jgi:hypothetical protein
MAIETIPTTTLTLHAVKVLQQNPPYLDDARHDSLTGSTVAGMVLSNLLHVSHREAEQAVRDAVQHIDRDAS